MIRSRLARNIRLGLKDLTLHKLRSFLTMLGIVFGVGSVIAMLAVGEGASKQALEQIRKLGSHNIIISSVKPSEEDEQDTRQSHMSMYGLLYDDELRIRETLTSVRRTVPVRLLRKRGRLGERSMELRVVGTTPEWFELVSRPVLAGRVISARDMSGRAAVCVLTEHGARRLLATGHTVGEKVLIAGHYFEIIGICRTEEGSTNIQVPDQATDAYIPFSVALERYGEASYRRSAGSREIELVELHQLLVEVDALAAVEPAAEAIRALLGRFHRREDYRISVPLTLLRQAEATKRRFNIVLGSIAGISLLVGGIGIMNIMLASVTERTREIGIRRAIGARRRQIVMQFLVETVVLSALGGVLGIGFGLVTPWAITRLSGMPTVVPFYSVALSLAISMSVGLVFGIYPALRAARLDPIVALRHE